MGWRKSRLDLRLRDGGRCESLNAREHLHSFFLHALVDLLQSLFRRHALQISPVHSFQIIVRLVMGADPVLPSRYFFILRLLSTSSGSNLGLSHRRFVSTPLETDFSEVIATDFRIMFLRPCIIAAVVRRSSPPGRAVFRLTTRRSMA